MQSAKCRIGFAYNRLYKQVRAEPFLNCSLFIIHYSLEKRLNYERYFRKNNVNRRCARNKAQQPRKGFR